MWRIYRIDGNADSVTSKLPDRKPNKSFDLDQYLNRPAVELLRDYISSFESLEWIPGGLYSPGSEEVSERR